MYLYDEIDQRLVDERVAQFRDQTRRFLAGQLTEDEFQRAAAAQRPLHPALCADAAHRDPLRDAVDAAAAQARSHRPHVRPRLRPLHARARTCSSTGRSSRTCPRSSPSSPRCRCTPSRPRGNCIRNITTDHFAGVAPDEIVDSFVWCEIVRQWSTFHPEFTYLPRKFKIAVERRQERTARRSACTTSACMRCTTTTARSASACSSAAASAARRSSASSIREFLPWPHLLTYLEAILRVYNRYGRRDNIHKARIKILVKERGAGEIPRRSRGRVGAPQGRSGDAHRRGSARACRRASRGPPYEAQPASDHATMRALAATCVSPLGHKRNVQPHKVPGYAAVTLSLKKTGVPPGDVTSRPDGRDRRSRGPLLLRRAARHARAEPGAGRRAPARPGRAVARGARARPRDAEHRPAHQHHRVPRRRLLRPGERQVDPGRRRRSRSASTDLDYLLRHRRARPQHLRLHERLRPPPRRPHRHPRRR